MSKFGSALFVSREQFGYLTDMVRWVSAVSADIQITVVCLDQNRPRIVPPKNVRLIYCGGESKFSRWLNLFKSCKSNFRDAQVILVKYFPGASIFALCMGVKKTILDFRTLSVSTSVLKRASQNLLMWAESRVVKHVSGVSIELLELLGRPDGEVIGLGGDVLARPKKTAPSQGVVRLVYVGTLDGRDLEVVVGGVCKYLESRNSPKVTLTLVGTGSPEIQTKLRRIVESHGQDDFIKFEGFQGRNEIANQLRSADFGIVQVPNESRYKVQPSTKLFEYWGAGLPVLASDYPMNRLYVQEGAGFLYKSSEEGFLSTLQSLETLLGETNYDLINSLGKKYSWHNQLEGLESYLERVIFNHD